MEEETSFKLKQEIRKEKKQTGAKEEAVTATAGTRVCLQ